jgi:hypothetical protein
MNTIVIKSFSDDHYLNREVFMNINNTFLRLYDSIESAVEASSFGELDLESEGILIFIANRQLKNEEVCASDIINDKSLIGSPVTLFQRIQLLKASDWIISEQSDQHHRKLKLTLSDKAIENINMISAILQNILKAKFGCNS